MLESYQRLTAGNPRFTTLTSAEILTAAEALGNAQLLGWVRWYRDLYAV